MPAIGSANNSKLIYPAQGNLRDTPWACSAWLYVRSDGGGGNPRYLLNLAASGPNYGITWRRQNASGGSLEIFKTNGAGFASYSGLIQTAAGSFPLHTWIHVIVENDYPTGTDATKFRAFINGTQENADALLANDLTDFNTELDVLGRYNATTLSADGAIHKLLWIKNRIFTADERAALLAGRYPSTIATSDVYFRADYDDTLAGIDSNGNSVAVTTNENTVNLVAFPANLPGMAFCRRADSGAYVDAGTNLATHKTSCQQWNDATGIGNGNSSQATAANRPGVKKTATGPGPDIVAFGNSNDRATYNESDQATAKWLDSTGGPGFDPRNSTVVAFGAQRACQTNGGVSFDFFQYLVHCGTPGTSGVFCCGMARGQLGVYTYNGSAYSNLKQGTLAVSATPCMFGWIMSSGGVTGFVGERTESLGSALPSASATTGIRLGASPDASPSHNSCAYVDLTAVCIYQRVLDATDLAALNDYFADTYNITKHDDRSVVVLCEGSSTMFGTYSTHNLNFIGSLPDENSRDWKIVNFGTGGLSFSGASGFDARWSDTMGNAAYWQETPNNRKLIFVLAVNFNDITDAGITDDAAGAATLIARFDDLAARARALRGAVIGVTFFRDYKTTARDLYNAHVLANSDSVLDLKLLADNAEITIVTGDPHMNANSQEVIGPYLRSAVLEAISVLNNRRGGASRTRPARQRILR